MDLQKLEPWMKEMRFVMGKYSEDEALDEMAIGIILAAVGSGCPESELRKALDKLFGEVG